MWSIFKKEVGSFFSSLVGYVVIGVFLILLGLVMWVFPDTSILNYKYATLETLFSMAPIIFTFLIPAITMRSLAEEKQTGTIELLSTRPITDLEIVLGKYFANVLLLIFALLPTLLYYYTVHDLGSPKGNLDSGAIMGSYLGLLLLGGVFTAVGLFASSLSRNQISSFILATFLCFFLFWGFFYLSKLPVFVGKMDDLIQMAGVEYHYLSISRGLVDSRDVVYFIGVTGIFLMLCLLSLKNRVLEGSVFNIRDFNWKEVVLMILPAAVFIGWNAGAPWLVLALIGVLLTIPAVWAVYLIKRSGSSHQIIQPILAIAIFAALMVAGQYAYASLDLTEEKRFTLTRATKKVLEEVNQTLYVQILLDGEFPAGFKRLRTAAKEMLDDFRSVNGLIEYSFDNPGLGTREEVNQRRKVLADNGIIPTNLRVKDVDETKELIIYPWAIFNYKGRSFPVNLLENEMRGVPSEVVLNNSVSLLEYKFANALKKLRLTSKPNIIFTTGHGELPPILTADLEQTLAPFYNTARLELDSIYRIGEEASVLVVAKPQGPFSERDKFLIDQYVMRGGKVMWLIDRLNVNLDSLQGRTRYIPFDYPLQLEDILFKYGVKIRPNLVLDLECTRIPLATGANFEMFPWYYHPLVAPRSNHPIVKSLDRINFFFPSTIDTFRTKTPVKKTVLLESSPYSRFQMTPVQLNFEILRYKPDKDKFNKGPQPVAVLLEGRFPSLYENRVPESMKEGLQQLNEKFLTQSDPTKMLVVSDGDVTKNLLSGRGGKQEVMPLGFNKYEETVFANKDFLVNAIEYLLDDEGVIEARSKEVKLRMLDTVRAREEATYWQLFNLVVPLIFLGIFGYLFQLFRKRKYTNT